LIRVASHDLSQMQDNPKNQHHGAPDQQPVAFPHPRVVAHRGWLNKLPFGWLLLCGQTIHLGCDARQVLIQPDIFNLGDPLPHRIGPNPQFLGCGHDVFSLVVGIQLFLDDLAAGSAA
jgi:hypothetical protein